MFWFLFNYQNVLLLLQKDTDSVINKRVDEISLELKRTEAKNSSLTSDLQKANSALAAAQGECSVLKTKLQELEAHLTKADANKEVETRLQVRSFCMKFN